MIYTVQLKDLQGMWQHSRYFETLGAARSWKKWLLSLRYVTGAQIYRGAAGGEVVE